MRFKYFATAIAAITLAGCSNNDDVPAGNKQPDAGSAAYLKVKINQTGGSGVSRGSVPTGEGASEFEQATADEYSISNAKFYFYDEEGNYLLQGSLNSNPGGNESNTTTPDLDFKSNAIIVLENQTGKGFPKYMVTILNTPETFSAEKKPLSELETMLALASNIDTQKEGKVWNETTSDNVTKRDNFIMTTSSYLQTYTTENPTLTNRTVAAKNYFVTEIQESDYKTSAAEADNESNSPVQIYVERLAARVSLGLASSLTNTKTTDDGKTIYELEEVTVAGENNTDVNADNAQGTPTIAKKLYANIVGWGLTNTAKNSYLMMNLSDSWTTNVPFTSWYAANQYRSYWGMSYLYNQDKIDNNLIRNSYAGAASPVGHPTTETKGNATVVKSGAFNYCAENTRIASKLTSEDVLRKEATSVLLTAELVDGELPLS